MAGAAHVDYQYKHFKATIPERKIFVGIVDQLEWRYYDTNPKSGLPPLVCLGGVAATSDVFYKQLLSLSARGYRVLAMDSPAIWSQEKWVKGFDHFLDALRIHQVHLYGTSLGGFLFQLYAQHRPRRVLSLVLSNSFLDTRSFHAFFGPWATAFPWAPDFVLKKLVLSGFKDGAHEPLIADSIDFVVARMDQKLSRSELASRLSLNTQLAAVGPMQLGDSAITIMDCNDFASVPGALRDVLYQRYPEARRAFLKSGGDFPFLSRADEVNLHLLLHLRRVEAAHEGPSDDDLIAQQQAADALIQKHSTPPRSSPPSALRMRSAGSSRRRSTDSGEGEEIEEEVVRSEVVYVDSGLEETFSSTISLGEVVGDPLGVSSGKQVSDPWEDSAVQPSLVASADQGDEDLAEQLRRRASIAANDADSSEEDAKDVHVVHQSSWAESSSDTEGVQVKAGRHREAGEEFGGRLSGTGEFVPEPVDDSPLQVVAGGDRSEVESSEGVLSPHSPGGKSLGGGEEDMGVQAREWLRGVEEEHYGWGSGVPTESQARDWLKHVENEH